MKNSIKFTVTIDFTKNWDSVRGRQHSNSRVSKSQTRANYGVIFQNSAAAYLEMWLCHCLCRSRDVSSTLSCGMSIFVTCTFSSIENDRPRHITQIDPVASHDTLCVQFFQHCLFILIGNGFLICSIFIFVLWTNFKKTSSHVIVIYILVMTWSYVTCSLAQRGNSSSF